MGTYLENCRKFLLVKHNVLQIDVDFVIRLVAQCVKHLALVDDVCADTLQLVAFETAGPRVALEDAVLEHLTVLAQRF